VAIPLLYCMSAKYILFCHVCGWKKLTDGSDLQNMVEVKTCNHCSGARQFKCPGCGRLVRAAQARTETVTDGQESAKKLTAQAQEKEVRMYNRDKELLENPGADKDHQTRVHHHLSNAYGANYLTMFFYLLFQLLQILGVMVEGPAIFAEMLKLLI